MTQTVPPVCAELTFPGARRTDGSSQNGLLADLLIRCAARDEAAMADLYDLTSEWIYAVVRRRTASIALAEDALVKVYTAVWRRAATFSARQRSGLAWMTSIAFETIQSRSSFDTEDR
jgi:DNA-directed RNA polymerase specialized sigma24 family protein